MASRRSWLVSSTLVVATIGSGCLPSIDLEAAIRSSSPKPLARTVAETAAARNASSAPGLSNRSRQDGGESMICPVVGFAAIADNFGAPRGQGRIHDGIDMFGAAGLPVVAVVSGSVSLRSGLLGGLAARLLGDDGTSYFYGHLESFEGTSRVVTQGEIIGYLGATGNADGVPHLHFEIRPNRGRPVNPY
ncbi:MAG: hypothetical protein RL413_1768, partial [Actinomycetota bacterium]